MYKPYTQRDIDQSVCERATGLILNLGMNTRMRLEYIKHFPNMLTPWMRMPGLPASPTLPLP